MVMPSWTRSPGIPIPATASRNRWRAAPAQLPSRGRGLAKHPPERTLLDSEHSVSTDRWHSFLAEIAIADLAESPDDPDARAFAADALMSFWYATYICEAD
jgi:hypothetical protein